MPDLRDALRKSPGGWVAKPLGQIGTPEAIQVLIEDTEYGFDGQTGFVLSHMGAKVIPSLFPLLEDAQKATPAAEVIRGMGSAATPFAVAWASLANDTQKPAGLRLAALRGIAAIGPPAESACAGIHQLLTDPDPTLREQARVTFRAVRDPAVVMQLAENCQPKAPPFDPLAFESYMRLREIAAYGDGAHDASKLLLSFLKSENGSERAYGITLLGMAGYQPAVPEIVGQLDSPDWRIVYAAARALGWLGAGQAALKISQVASNHWLPEVREIGRRTVEALRSPNGRLARPAPATMEKAEGPFEVDQNMLGKVGGCLGRQWKWDGTGFTTPSVRAEADKRLPLWGGTLFGTDHGEFMGDLTWRTDSNRAESILKDNVTAIAPTQDGNAIALFGFSNGGFDYGYVLRIERVEGHFHLTEAARLPAEGDDLIPLSPDVFAVPTAGRVVVLSSHGVLGLAACQ